MNESLMLAQNIADTGYDDIPGKVADTTKKSLLDGIGTMLAGGGLGEGCKEFVNLAIAIGGKEESTIIGFDAKVPACMAAFANGSMAHAMDFEDTHNVALVHPNAAAIPAALAVAEYIGNVSGKDLITALTLGSNIVGRLSLTLKVDPIKYGWHMPPILGAIGAAAAASKLLNLSPEQILDAFSLSLCQITCSAEFTRSPRSIARAIREAFSTKAGVLSAQLAERGITGFEQPIEGEAGLFRLYAREDYDLTVLTKGLGKIFEGANISFKPWPSCRGTHPFIEQALQVSNSYNLKPDDIKDIRLVMAPAAMPEVLCEPLERKRSPVTAIDAKFSIPFTVATALVYGEVALRHFTPQALRDAKVLEVARRITYEIDTKIEARSGYLQIKTEQGKIETEMVEFASGHPKNPISQEALIAKFTDCAAHSAKQFSQKNLDKVVQLISHLEDVKDIGEITECL